MNSFLFPILSVIAAIGLYFFFVSPTLAEIDLLKAKDTEFSKSLNDLREIEGIIGRLESDYASISRTDLEKLERFLPRKLDRTQVLRDMDSLLDREGVIVSSINFENSSIREDGLPVLEHNIVVSFFANYEIFKSILNDIEKNLQIAGLRAVSVTAPRAEIKGTDSSVQGLTNFSLSLKYFSYDLDEKEQ